MACSIPRRDRTEGRLSYAQERVWLVDQLTGPASVYNVPVTLRLAGRLDVAALQAALDAIVARHAALRTVFVAVDGEPIQRVKSSFAITLALDDVGGQPGDEREGAALHAATRSARQPFDLERGPLVRALLVRLQPGDHVLALTFHHLVFDGGSEGPLYREIEALYSAAVTGTAPVLEPLPIQFIDFAEWQRQQDGGPTAAYWQGVFDRAPIPPGLAIAPARPPGSVPAASVRARRIGPALAEAAGRFCRDRDTTPFLLYFAIYLAWLWKRTGSDDLVVSVPAAGRTQAETERLIGFFANSLPIRMRVAPSSTFAAFLSRVRDIVLDGWAHQEISSEVLLRLLPRRPGAAHGSLIPLAFAVETVPAPPRLPGIAATPLHVDLDTAKTDFTLTLVEQADAVAARAIYAADAFGADEVDGMLEEFGALARAALAHPNASLASLCALARVRPGGANSPVLCPDIRTAGAPRIRTLLPARDRQLLDEWNRTDAPGTTDLLVTDLFDVSAARDGGAIAVEGEEEQVGYRELQARADRAAASLEAEGAGPETVVAICMPRSVAQLVAVLAILKAGAAYLPLDPALPRARIDSVLQTSGARLIVTTRSLQETLQRGTRATVTIEDLLSAGGPPQPAMVGRTVLPHNLACVIYTSGSTGTPKGVEIEHGSLANYIRFVASCVHITPRDRVLQFASLGFDAAAEEIFSSLATGATLVLRREAMFDSADAFLDGCEARRLTILDLPTAYWHMLVDVAADKRTFPSGVHTVIVGGEAVRRDLLARWRAWTGSRVRLLNGYGPTETTVCCTYADLTLADTDGPDAPVSIGTPIWNTQVHVLDPSGQPVPVEVPGEIAVGGLSLARGYRHDPELTARRFGPDPFRAGGRLYLTGDRGRWRRTGELEYLGRLDQQVKIRGHRVEPAEIEMQLRQHPLVREAAVVAHAADGEPRLVAYVETRDAATPADLRTFLADRLPAAMIPAAFVSVRALPRTVNGKVDLPALQPPPDEPRLPSRAPQTTVERVIASSWSELLHVPGVGADDNFFDLGGQSLVGTRIVARISRALRVHVPLWLLFEHPTVAALAAAVEQLLAGPAPPDDATVVAGAPIVKRRTAKRGDVTTS